LAAAYKIDTLGSKTARDHIAAIKIVAPKMACEVIDRAIQILGGKGLSNDTPLAYYYTMARALRLADGPDEVHMYQLGRNLIKAHGLRTDAHTPYFDEEN
jgi:acyl-CoA dehydrogenase